MKLGFVTCVQLGLSCMEAIYEAGGELSVAFTLLDHRAKDKSGRVYLDEFCDKRQIPLHKVKHVNNQVVKDVIAEHELDWLFIIGWSQIANAELLAAPKLGVLGMHPTLLPLGRGRAAIPWAILKGLDKTGVTLFKLDEGVDTGPVLAQYEIPLTDNTDATELYAKVDDAHVTLMREVIPQLIKGEHQLQVQDESKATEWPGRKPEDGEINLAGSVQDAHRLVRAVAKPYPGAFYYQDDKKHIVWSATIVDKAAEGEQVLTFSDGLLRLDSYEVN